MNSKTRHFLTKDVNSGRVFGRFKSSNVHSNDSRTTFTKIENSLMIFIKDIFFLFPPYVVQSSTPTPMNTFQPKMKNMYQVLIH